MTHAVSYEEQPYPRLAFPYTRPEHLAAHGILFGLRPAPANRCRVLELGCARAANLLPMAYALPESQFVGIDLSPGQIAEGQEVIARLGIKNLELRCVDLMEVDDSLGQFDYIIAHGLYSWVSQVVKDKVLEVCKRLLAPQGVAYVSYKTYPGGHVADMVRQMCLFHNRDLRDSSRWGGPTREFLALLRTSVPAERDVYRAVVTEQCRILEAEPAGALLHDDLEAHSDPIYFHEFVAHAGQHGLQYLGDADYQAMNGGGLEAAALERISQSGDWIEFEQYLDFLYGRSFRTSLLCHAGLELERPPEPMRVTELHVTGSMQPYRADGNRCEVSEVSLSSDHPQQFRAGGTTLEVHEPLAKAALVALGVAGLHGLRFSDLLEEAQARIATAGGGESAACSSAEPLAACVLDWYAADFVELHASVPNHARAAGDRPVASALARLQAERDWQVTNLLHRPVTFTDDAAKQLLRRLDGTQDRTALVAQLEEPIRTGRVEMRIKGRTVNDAAEIRRHLAAQVDQCLDYFAKQLLLMP